MNEELEPFEQRLSRQPLRRVPAEWRAEILAAVGRESRGDSRKSGRLRPSALVSRLSTFFWPHPAAWAGLAAVWFLILAVNLSDRGQSPAVVENSAPPSPRVVAELKQQQRMFVELIGAPDSKDADHSKTLPPRPRTERVEILSA